MRRMMAGGALLVALLALGGCVASGSGSTAEPGAVDGGGVIAPGMPVFEDGPQSGEDAGGEGSAGDDVADRDVIVTGSMVVTADDPIAASREAARIVEAAGGRVDSRSESAASDFGPGSAWLTLRIPGDRLEPVLEQLRDLGRADRLETSAADVSVQRRDLDARISALEASIGRLQALMADADDISDLILIEGELSRRQAELESLQAQRRYLADQVDMSTIRLELRAPESAGEPEPGSFWEGVMAGWGAFLAFWSVVLVVLGALLPWLVFFGLIAAAVLLVVRRRRRRKTTSESD